MATSNRARRDKLWTSNPHCHWCGIETVLYRRKLGEALPPNAATLDHVYNKLDERRRHDHSAVLACNRCNFERGKAAEQDRKQHKQQVKAARRRRYKERRRQRELEKQAVNQ